jgi:hypothetical protein
LTKIYFPNASWNMLLGGGKARTDNATTIFQTFTTFDGDEPTGPVTIYGYGSRPSWLPNNPFFNWTTTQTTYEEI